MKDFLLKLWYKTLIPGMMLGVATAWLLQFVWPVDQGIKRIFFLAVVWNVIIYLSIGILIVRLFV